MILHLAIDTTDWKVRAKVEYATQADLRLAAAVVSEVEDVAKRFNDKRSPAEETATAVNIAAECTPEAAAANLARIKKFNAKAFYGKNPEVAADGRACTRCGTLLAPGYWLKSPWTGGASFYCSTCAQRIVGESETG